MRKPDFRAKYNLKPIGNSLLYSVGNMFPTKNKFCLLLSSVGVENFLKRTEKENAKT